MYRPLLEPGPARSGKRAATASESRRRGVNEEQDYPAITASLPSRFQSRSHRLRSASEDLQSLQFAQWPPLKIRHALIANSDG